MKKVACLLLIICLLAPSAFADRPDRVEKRGVLMGILFLEGRGFSNLALFPAEWPIIAQEEFGGHFWKGTVTFLPTVVTHAVGRVCPAFVDILWTPLTYPFVRNDESVPVGLGWGEFPWQKSNA